MLHSREPISQSAIGSPVPSVQNPNSEDDFTNHETSTCEMDGKPVLKRKRAARGECDTDEICPIPGCNKYYARRYALQRHVFSEHTVVLDYETRKKCRRLWKPTIYATTRREEIIDRYGSYDGMDDLQAPDKADLETKFFVC